MLTGPHKPTRAAERINARPPEPFPIIFNVRNR
jgi:hypothetical protein